MISLITRKQKECLKKELKKELHDSAKLRSFLINFPEEDLPSNFYLYREIDNYIRKGDYFIVKELFKRREEKQYKSFSPSDFLDSACEAGHLDILKYLIRQGADINSYHGNPLLCAIKKDRVEIVKYLIFMGVNFHRNEEEALMTACKKGNLEIVKILVEAGADVNADNHFSIVSACYNGSLEVVKYLVEKGCPVVSDTFFWAERKKFKELMEYLEKNKYSVYKQNK